MKKPQTFYYKDEVNDDFAELPLKRPIIDENYKYIRNNKINVFFSACLFYLVLKPILSLYGRCCGIRVKNRKNFKQLRNSSVFIYANHTSYFDAIIIQSLVVRLKRTCIIGYSDASAIPVAKHIVNAAGYLPIPTTLKASVNFVKAIEYRTNLNQNILIYPEAHIWPTYTKIRPFAATSFHYPAKFNKPVIPVVTVYRKSKISKNPKITLVVGDPIYPKAELSINENKQYLRDECYKQMCDISNSYKQYEYHKFVKIDKSSENDSSKNNQ